MAINEQIYGYYKMKNEAGDLIETSIRAKVKVGSSYEPGPDIPRDSANVDWINYEKWVSEGNTIEIFGDSG
tara:strand:+ start:269 stop:481 length:213 start_codon:yes stop_codon:yes gene_type:complete